MSNHTIHILLHAIIFISDSFFLGLKFLVPLIFLITLFDVKITALDLPCLTLALNWLMLIGGVLFLLTISTNTTMILLSGNEDERDFMLGAITGSHWYQFIFPVLNYGLLPSILWIRIFRKTIFLSFVIILFWLITYFVNEYFNGRNASLFSSAGNSFSIPALEYAEKILVFLLFLIIFYLRIRSTRKSKANS